MEEDQKITQLQESKVNEKQNSPQPNHQENAKSAVLFKLERIDFLKLGRLKFFKMIYTEKDIFLYFKFSLLPWWGGEAGKNSLMILDEEMLLQAENRAVAGRPQNSRLRAQINYSLPFELI